jgi:hypothetical protein
MTSFTQKFSLLIVATIFLTGCLPYQVAKLTPEEEQTFLSSYGVKDETIQFYRGIYIIKGTAHRPGHLVLTDKGLYVLASTRSTFQENTTYISERLSTGEFLLAQWKYSERPHMIFDSNNINCFWGCGSGFRIYGYKFMFFGPDKAQQREAYEILQSQGVQVEVFTKEMGKTFLENFGEDGEKVLHEQEVFNINNVYPLRLAWSGNLIFTTKGIYLFSEMDSGQWSRMISQGKLQSHQYTEEFLLGEWKYIDSPHIDFSCPLTINLRVGGYGFPLSGSLFKKTPRKLIALLKDHGIEPSISCDKL